MIAVNMAALGMLCRRKCSRTHLVCQTVSTSAEAVQLLCYYAEWCQPSTYQEIVFGLDVACTICMALLAFDVLRRRNRVDDSKWLTLVLLVTMFQVAKLDWHWTSMPFQWPDGAFAYLTPMRRVMNVAVMGWLCLMPYLGDGAITPQENTC